MISPNFNNTLDTLLQRLDTLNDGVLIHSGTLKSLRNQETGYANEVATLTEEILTLEKVNEALIHLVSVTTANFSTRIEELVTGGLQAVFTDQYLEFFISVSKKRHHSAISFVLKNNGMEFPLMRGTGGGVLAVIGVLLRVITIILLDMKRVLFLDETLVHVSKVYIENVSALLKKLCSDLEFKILLVTHQLDFVVHADHQYTTRRHPSGTGITFHKIK